MVDIAAHTIHAIKKLKYDDINHTKKQFFFAPYGPFPYSFTYLNLCNPYTYNGCNRPTTSSAQAFQHASSNDIHSHDE